MTFSDDAPRDAPSAPMRRVRFSPSDLERKLIAALRARLVPLPALPRVEGTIEARVRMAMRSLSRGLKTYDRQAARALRRGETGARICVIAVDVLGERCPEAELAGLMQTLGELLIWRILDRLGGDVDVDEAQDLARRYRGRAATDAATAWKLSRDVIRACFDGSVMGAPVATRLGRAGRLLVDAVETAMQGGTPTWDADKVATLGIDADSASLIVRDAARALRGR